MKMSLAELERAAYIRGRTYLARAYAAADDNAMVATKAQGFLESDDLNIDALTLAKLPQFIGALKAAQESVEDNEPQLTLDI